MRYLNPNHVAKPEKKAADVLATIPQAHKIKMTQHLANILQSIPTDQEDVGTHYLVDQLLLKWESEKNAPPLTDYQPDRGLGFLVDVILAE